MPGRRATHHATYEYEAKGRTFHGEYRCEGCLRNLPVKPEPGAVMSVEYRLADPAVSRPHGIITQGAARYRRTGLAAGVALLAVALLGFVFGAARPRPSVARASRRQPRRQARRGTRRGGP